MKKTLFFAVAGLLFTAFTACNNNTQTATESKSTDKVTQTDTISDPLSSLKAGNERFRAGKLIHGHQDSTRLKELVASQSPKAIIVSCSDSRVPPEIVFDQGLGDIFSVRTAGNVMSDYELGSIEYAAEHLGTKVIVVMGHEGCGAVKAFLEHQKDDNVPGHISAIVKALKSETEEQDALKNKDNVLPLAVRANVKHAVLQLQNCEPLLKEMYKSGKVVIVGAVYHLDNGQVEFLDIK